MKQERILHIIAFNIPDPPDYGGVIDVYYKLKYLYEAGIRIILHSYQYGREHSPRLNEFCEEVYYYNRERSIEYFFRRQPFIAVTRNSRELINRLQKDSHPVLFEGLHTCLNIEELSKNNRELIIRAHNIEHEYYSQLAKNENNILKKIFFISESKKLLNFEKQVYPGKQIASISSTDNDYFNNTYHNSSLIPAFHPYSEVNIASGFGDYILYHGNLSVPENIEASTFLIKNVFPFIQFPCIIAGKQPDKSILRNAEGLSNLTIIGNPDKLLMEDLISSAHINILPGFQQSGLKLKLLAALFRGRHCIANSKMVSGSGLESFCLQAEGASEIINMANELILKPFEIDEIQKRMEYLSVHFNNKLNATKLIQLIWPV